MQWRRSSVECGMLKRSSLYIKYRRDVVIPTVPYLALGEKQADIQTFQVFKTWKV
ncbi:hypothetical protein [Methylobacter sp.]|uniref:hypothetical protein n=1 Tax=Methylobacter sp. TaxID=2051955 RepID=UPI0025E609E2|nr:hypothetical protein [Methylobacter sp.]